MLTVYSYIGIIEQAMNLTMSINESSQNETITKTSSIAAMLANLTTSKQVVYAKEIDLAVTVVSALTKYVLSHFISYIIIWLCD